MITREGDQDLSSADQNQDQRRQLESGGRFKAILLSDKLTRHKYIYGEKSYIPEIWFASHIGRHAKITRKVFEQSIY